jgi:hypothetical protein
MEKITIKEIGGVMTNYTRLENIFVVVNLNDDQHVALERALIYFN